MSIYSINEGAATTAPTFTALTSPGGFIGDGQSITLNNPLYVVTTTGSNQLTTSQFISYAQGGLGNPSGFTAGSLIMSTGTSYAPINYTPNATASTVMSRDSSGNSAVAGFTATTLNATTSVTTPIVTASNSVTAPTITGNTLVTGPTITATSALNGPLVTASTSLTTPIANFTGTGTAGSLTSTILTLGNTNTTAAGSTVIRTSFVQTTGTTSATLFTLPTTSTATAGSKATAYLISADISFGDATSGAEVNSGFFSFVFKAKNVNGVTAASVSTLVHNISVVDTGSLANASVAVPAPTNANVSIVVTGATSGSTVVNWYGAIKIVQVAY